MGMGTWSFWAYPEEKSKYASTAELEDVDTDVSLERGRIVWRVLSEDPEEGWITVEAPGRGRRVR